MGCTTHSSDWTLTFSNGLHIIFDVFVNMRVPALF
jgi:hypothetical protein